MKHFLYITIATLMCSLCLSCKKTDQTPFFDGRSALAISGDASQGVVSDSLLFSFGTVNSTIIDTIIRINVRTIGKPSSSERNFKLIVNKSISTALSEEYEFPSSFIMPANSTKTTLSVKIKRSSRILKETARLVIDVEATDDFIPGPRLELTDQPVSGPRFSLSWTSLLTKPAAWDGFPNAGLIYILGQYSRTKHQIVIDATGIANYDNVRAGTDAWYYIYQKCSEWLNEYNRTHPGAPLRDENGKLVEFEKI